MIYLYLYLYLYTDGGKFAEAWLLAYLSSFLCCINFAKRYIFCKALNTFSIALYDNYIIDGYSVFIDFFWFGGFRKGWMSSFVSHVSKVYHWSFLCINEPFGNSALAVCWVGNLLKWVIFYFQAILRLTYLDLQLPLVSGSWKMVLVCVSKWWRVKLGNDFTRVLSKFL